ncbi:DNA2/NAM7 family helicase [Brucella oryzae]|uniref:DEAD/DEAH box helicase n=1 Tax=Brucella oryzae TaxID=335286 RepID=UPI001B820845|nr:AAA domain-containing protein [Brucella oryzae]MBR7652942.1 DNA2/NAM7 family helicase [Brucella oryzae]
MAARPYAQKSVFDLEAIFEQSRNNASELERLSNELTFRNTAKARTLSAKVGQALTSLRSSISVSVLGSGSSTRFHGPVAAQSSPAVSRDAPATVVQLRPTATSSAVTPQQFSDGQIDLGPLPSFSPSGKMNDARAILATWTALEALSPQGYKRPEDMAAGDRSRVALLERGIPWGPNARSKPNHRLYFEVVLGAIALDKATDELVKVFGEDEERSRPDGKKAAIGSILIDKEGYVLEDNGVAVSSFAWALKPALDLKLGSLGAWPKVEPRIIERLDRMVRRHNEDGDLPSESIGWLLVDEAGQAVPQAAVGAIMRAKRSIVVGDPLQIPPVVSLPKKLNAEICKFFDIDQIEWSAPAASTQTLADQASRFKSTFVTDIGDREVGLPLLVHRRCQNPMFDVSNSIAYAGQMVHAVGPQKPGPIGSVLGRSRWIDVNGDAETKWCPDEGDAVVQMLRELAASDVTNPDVFIITPFKIVEQEMRRRLDREIDLLRTFGVNIDEWSRDRVGTIHTFQGREADTVILLLGAPKASQHRARQWAASPPNIINVAVSRAKQNLYVVGSAAAWAGAGTSLQVLQRQLTQSA